MCGNPRRKICTASLDTGLLIDGFVRRIFADFAHLAPLIPMLLHAVWIDRVRPLETIVLAISRPERVMSPELRSIPRVGLTPGVL